MSWRSSQEAQERLRESEARMLQEFAAISQGSSASQLTPDPPVLCPSCKGLVPPREMRCPHCGYDFTVLAPEVAEHARRQVAVESGLVAGLRQWSRVFAMVALAVMAHLHAPGSVVLALAALVLLLPGLMSLAVVPLALVLLPLAHLHGPAMVLGILTLASWRAGARYLRRPTLSAEPLVAAAVGGAAVAVLGAGLLSLGWLEYPDWCARASVQPSDRGVVQGALNETLPGTVSIMRMRSPGRPWPERASNRPQPVLYDLQLNAEDWPGLAAVISPPRAFADDDTTVTSRTMPLLDDVLAFAESATETDDGAPESDGRLTVCRQENNLLVALDTATSPTLHLYLALTPSDY